MVVSESLRIRSSCDKLELKYVEKLRKALRGDKGEQRTCTGASLWEASKAINE